MEPLTTTTNQWTFTQKIFLCFVMLFTYVSSSGQIRVLSSALPKPPVSPHIAITDDYSGVKITDQPTAIDTTYYIVVNTDNAVGTQKKWKDPDGRLHYTIEYGYWAWADTLHTIIQLDSNNSLLKYNITGKTWGTTIIADSFQVIGKKAYWRNNLENDSALYTHQYYWSQKTTPAEVEVQLSFLKRTGAHSMNLLPSGRRTYEQTDRAEVSKADGSKTAVYLMRFTGYGDYPHYAWFTADGAFFAEVNYFIGTVKKGFEHNYVGLYQQQKLNEADYLRQLAVKSGVKAVRGYAITNVDVFDAKNKKVLQQQTVLIEGRMIKSIRPFTDKATGKGFNIIDGTGKFLMPGLWDSHAHTFDGTMWIAHGITNVIDMGNRRTIPQLKRLAAADSILHPDISVMSGFMDKAGSGTDFTGIQVTSLEHALRAIDTFKAEGYDQIKLYDLIEKDWVAPLSQKAKQLGMRTAGHIPEFMTADMAIDRGYNEINHFRNVMLNFLVDTSDKQSFSVPKLVPFKGSTIDIQSDKVKAFISKLKNNNIVIDPTLTLYERIYTQLPGQLAKEYAPVKDIIPADLRRDAEASWYAGGDTNVLKYAATWQKIKEMLLALYKGGVTLVIGADTYLDKGALLREMEIYSESGIPNSDILRMTTYVPASVHGKEKEYGNVKEGMVANLILLDANPLKNISNIRKLNLVFKNGKAYDPKKIKQEFGWRIE